jgi:preprotein translocase subunit YajC
MESLIFIVFLFVIVWLLFLMPARRRQRAHAAMQDSVDAGDEIITAGGLHGTVLTTGEEEVELEIAPDVVVRLDRRAIAAVARDVPVEPGDEQADEAGELEPAEEPVAAAENPDGPADELERKPDATEEGSRAP